MSQLPWENIEPSEDPATGPQPGVPATPPPALEAANLPTDTTNAAIPPATTSAYSESITELAVTPPTTPITPITPINTIAQAIDKPTETLVIIEDFALNDHPALATPAAPAALETPEALAAPVTSQDLLPIPPNDLFSMQDSTSPIQKLDSELTPQTISASPPIPLPELTAQTLSEDLFTILETPTAPQPVAALVTPESHQSPPQQTPPEVTAVVTPDITSEVAPETPAETPLPNPKSEIRNPKSFFPRWPLRNRGFATSAQGAHRVLIVGRVAVVLVTAGLMILLGRVWQLETRPGPKIASLIDTQKSQIQLLGRRGNIEDREGRLLATSHSILQLFVDPRLIQDPSTFAEHVGQALGYDPAMLDQRIGAHETGRYVLLDRRLDDNRVQSYKNLALRGLGTEPRLVRDYPQGPLAGQLIGVANIDGHGLEGVERLFDHDLAGQPGHLTYFRDTHRRALWVDSNQYAPPIDGKSVRLSIDLTIESYAESALASTCSEFGAPSGEMIVMDPVTGEVLAMANYPALDPNNFGAIKPDKRRNRAITDTFEPGSIFKPVVWSFATQDGYAKSNEWIDTGTSGAFVTAAGRHLHDAHASGRITWDEVLVHSSNIGMAIVGERMGAQELYKAVRSFGMGTPTHIGLPGEITGRVRPVKSWTTFSITSVPMGQEVSVTPMQMARAFCTFANGGYLVQPTIRMVEPQFRDTIPPGSQRILTPQIAAYTRQVLRRVVADEEGTGRKANSPMYDIFGKTGTAQIAAGHRGGYIPGAFTASFICGAPYNNPRIIVACVIHHPTIKNHFGGTVAAPAARQVVEQTLLYMGVPPNPVPEDGNGAPPLLARD